MDMFPPAASRGASIVAMNVALPALIFANIVPSFNPSNVSALGPMFLIASVYQIFGFLMGILIREVVYVPRNFWQGIVILTGMSNWGNLRQCIRVYCEDPLLNPCHSERHRHVSHAGATIQSRNGPCPYVRSSLRLSN